LREGETKKNKGGKRSRIQPPFGGDGQGAEILIIHFLHEKEGFEGIRSGRTETRLIAKNSHKERGKGKESFNANGTVVGSKQKISKGDKEIESEEK